MGLCIQHMYKSLVYLSTDVSRHPPSLAGAVLGSRAAGLQGLSLRLSDARGAVLRRGSGLPATATATGAAGGGSRGGAAVPGAAGWSREQHPLLIADDRHD